MKLILGDCIDKLKELPENSVDSIITDPPYELGFMGKSWDNTGIANNVNMWKECLRVLKPGGHLLSFSGTRTYHRMASAIEDAGFEIRDMIEWVYGSGFPKSLNIGKQLDRMNGVDNIQHKGKWNFEHGNMEEFYRRKKEYKKEDDKPLQTEQAKQWEGWGTALKPAHEPICMGRKPLSEKTVAENVLKWGTGGINIDGSRVGNEERTYKGMSINQPEVGTFRDDNWQPKDIEVTVNGRFPANLIHDNSEEVRECFPESNSGKGKASTYEKFGGQWGKGKQIRNEDYGDSGNAYRFFKSIIYTAKASKSERNKGLDDLPKKPGGSNAKGYTEDVAKGLDRNRPVANFHPTVKPVKLMEYLITMVTPKNGIVLDPFMGSGSTGVACRNLGFDFIGIEKEEDYLKIAEGRIGL